MIMATYNKKIVEQIIDLMEEGGHSVSAICKIVGIGRRTFYDWRNAHPEFSQAMEEAEQRRSEELRELAKKGLKRKLEGYYQTVSRTVYVPSMDDPETLEIKQHVVTRKYCEPDTKLLLDILEIGTGKRKRVGGKMKGISPALVVKRSEKEVQKGIDEIRPFTIKAKEVVKHTLRADEKDSDILIEESDKRKEVKDELPKIESQLLNEPEKSVAESQQKSEELIRHTKKYEPVPPPVPSGYTRRA